MSVSPSITYQSGFSQRAVAFYVRNGVMYFAIGINHANTLNGDTTYTVATMPTGFRPTTPFSAVDVFNGAFVNIKIDVDGAITAYLSAQKTAGWFWVRGCYLLA